MLKFLVYLGMPYYRIIVWTKRRKKPYEGIRMIQQNNINAVYQTASNKAIEMYRNDFVDVEVQMLSKLCTAVRALQK